MTFCNMCKLDTNAFARCEECAYNFCSERCMRFGPSVPTSFTCPDCCSANLRECAEAVQKFKPVQVSVLVLYLTSCIVVAGSLLNVLEGTLRAQGTTTEVLMLNLVDAISSPLDMLEWLEAVQRRGTLLVLLVTETSDIGYWVQAEGNYAWPEIELLDRLFVVTPEVYALLRNIRLPVLFIVSCGGNLSKSKIDLMHGWNVKNNCFTHMFAFLNTRLIASEMAGFFSKLVGAAFDQLLPFHRAVVAAWCSDENARYHSGLLWLTLMGAPRALRLNTAKCPYGIQLPDLSSLCKCPSDKQQWNTRKWQPGPGESASRGILKLSSRCCKMPLRLVLEEAAPKTFEHSGVGYVLDVWPARPKHRIFVPEEEKRTEKVEALKRAREDDDELRNAST
ncbi:hypothetical protein BDV93DRAFT_611466 [Ceratobasidium sp. AG-I]|nr:hypothetical protein BDV93DRAFT_611466 [Ceratobasidium sp. AG-I]